MNITTYLFNEAFIFSVSDYKVLQKVVQLSGYAPESVARPEKIRDKETEDRDVYPR
jgi:hypothetical protein